MASSSGASSGSTSLTPNSGSEGGLHAAAAAAVEQRKQKRMLSNRESARRSRQRKQRHLDELAAQVSALRRENGQILAALSVTAQHCLGVESENSVLRARVVELGTRLQSLNEILHCVGWGEDEEDGGGGGGGGVDLVVVNQPIMASPDMFLYC